jgi:hypothetical protein
MSKDEKLSWDEVGEIIENTPGTYEQLILHLETVGKILQSLSQMLQYKVIKTPAPRDTICSKLSIKEAIIDMKNRLSVLTNSLAIAKANGDRYLLWFLHITKQDWYNSNI